MSIRDFRDLIVWQKSIDLAVSIYDLTGRFPREERFGLTSQLRRASISVGSNIAEGSGRDTRPDLIRFISMARGSLEEAESLLIVSERLNFTTQAHTATAWSQADAVGRMLTRLRSNLRDKR